MQNNEKDILAQNIFQGFTTEAAKAKNLVAAEVREMLCQTLRRTEHWKTFAQFGLKSLRYGQAETVAPGRQQV